MESCNSMNYTCKVSLSLLILYFFAYNITAISENLDSPLTENPKCKNVSCGQGNCVASSSTNTGYECQCFEGWKQIEAGPFPNTCIIPNCSIDIHCGGNAPPQPLGGIPVLNIFSPCNLVWCYYGECVANGTEHYCQCQPDNENLFDNPALACFPQCVFGEDCKKVGLGQPSPPPSKSGSSNSVTGSKNGANCLRKVQGLIVIVLSAILHAWI